MSSEDNKKHLKQILYREAIKQKEAGLGGGVAADSFAPQDDEPLIRWIHVKGRIDAILGKLNKGLSAIDAAVIVNHNTVHDYSNHEYPTIGRLRLDFFQGNHRTNRHIELNVAENGMVHLYTYLSKAMRRFDIDVEEMDDDRIEALLLDFVDLSTRDEFPRHP